MTTTQERIEWRSRRYSAQAGFLADVQVFSISFGVVRNELPYVLRTTLPGFKNEARNFATEAEAKKVAELTLQHWMKRVGLEFTA